jgi:phage tail sheath protein FI
MDVTDGLDAFMRYLVPEGAIINFEAFLGTEQNTASQIA